MLISWCKTWSLAAPLRTNLIQTGDYTLTSALGWETENGLKSFVRGHQCLSRCRALSRKRAQTHAFHLIIFLHPVLQHVPACSRLHWGKLSSWWDSCSGKPRGRSSFTADQSLSPTKHRMHAMQSAHPRQATKALSKWGDTATCQANTSPTPWLLWGQSHYPKRQNYYKSVISSKNMSIFTLQPSIKHKRPLVLFTAEIAHTSSEGTWTPLWGLRTLVQNWKVFWFFFLILVFTNNPDASKQIMSKLIARKYLLQHTLYLPTYL